MRIKYVKRAASSVSRAHGILEQHELLEELAGRFAQEKYKLLVNTFVS